MKTKVRLGNKSRVVTFQLSHPALGDFGTIEITKEALLFMLEQEQVNNDEDPIQPPPYHDEDLRPWELIEVIDEESELAREMVRLREQEKLTIPQVSERLLETHGVKKTPQVIYNTITALRHKGYDLPNRRKNPIRSQLDQLD